MRSLMHSLSRFALVLAASGRRRTGHTGCGRRQAARRQGRARGVFVRAARCRHAQRASSRRTTSSWNSPPSRATRACSRPPPPTRIDILLGSGPAMAFIAKGSPIKGVAAMAGPPLLLAIVVKPDGPKTVADLKGKTVSVSTAGSLTYWLVSETSRRQGWGPERHQHRADGGHAGPDRRAQARRHRRHHHGHRQRLRPREEAARPASWCASPTSRTSTSM